MTDDLTPTEGATLYWVAHMIVQRLEDADVSTRRADAPVPRGTVSCGEAWNLFPLLMVLLEQKFPQLADPETLTELLHRNITDSASGLPN